MTDEQRTRICKIVNDVPEIQSLLYNLDLLPEQTMGDVERWHYTVSVVEHIAPVLAERDALKAALAQQREPDMRHPKIQSLIGQNARKNIIIGLIEQLLEDPNLDPSAMEMEYWDSMHDKLKEKLAPTIPDGWISVEDWLPNPGEENIICWCGWPITGVYRPKDPMRGDHDWYSEPVGMNPIFHVTHWMPLPSPPAAVKEKP